ncbi:DUF4129 domain-containing protein [Paenibacillus dendritiformis]|uniref:DUF4129 domain-containing protein n=1 Tax=Paenibacillus dendritiformis TaxID=130049 RepID=UPI00143DFAF9|nr:DUF4129 domain-containing protein [Paenibacillus dendritiformis]NKI22952.1 DUF4129 domain-containing protein [Paenibacillus dendritiformis]NRG01196.1 DUF4129 domain-containing protein [Paenibacillus dendritiformis]
MLNSREKGRERSRNQSGDRHRESSRDPNGENNRERKRGLNRESGRGWHWNRGRGFGISLLRALLDYLILFPVLLLISEYAAPAEAGPLLWYGLWPACAAAGTALQTAARFKRLRLWLLLLFVAGSAMLAAVVPLQLPNIAVYAAGFIVFARGTSAVANRSAFGDTVHWNWAALGMYFLVFALSFFRPELRALQPHLAAVGVLFVFGTLWQMNWGQLNKANYSAEARGSVPAQVMRLNASYLILFFLALVLIVAFTFGSAMDTLMEWTRMLLGWIFSGSEQIAVDEPPPPQAAPQMPLFGADANAEPSLFWKLLERVITVVFWVALAVGALAGMWFLLLFLMKKLFPRAWDALLRFLRKREAEPEAADYVDEQSSTFEWEKLRRRVMKPWAQTERRWRRERYDDLKTNRERVRFLYRERLRQASGQGYEPDPGRTPKETMEHLRQWEERGAGGGQGGESELGKTHTKAAKSELSDGYIEAARSEPGEAYARAAKSGLAGVCTGSVESELGDAYTEARYGKRDIPDETVNRLARQIRGGAK